jgi:hypothetical protein
MISKMAEEHHNSQNQPSQEGGTPDSDPQFITVTIKDHLGARLTDVCVPNDRSVGDLKYEIEDRLFMPPTQQRLFFKGIKLENGPALDDYEISDGSTIHLRTTANAKEMADSRAAHRPKKDRLPKKVAAFMVQRPEVLMGIFDLVDRNKDRVISHEEVKAALYETIPGLQPEDMSAIFRALDDNGSEFISRREWMEFFCSPSELTKRSAAKKMVSDIESVISK